MRHRLSYSDWSAAEYRSLLASFITARINEGGNEKRLAHVLDQLYAPSNVFPVNFGHTAISMALALFKRQSRDRDEVIVPMYICPSVPKTIERAGLVARFVGVGSDLNIDPAAVKNAFTSRTLAVVAAHIYGCPASIATLDSLCRAHNVFLIDDAAQVLGVEENSRLLGTFGDVGVLSFAQSKTVVTGVGGSGGALVVSNPLLKNTLEQAWHDLPVARTRALAVADFLWNYLWARYTAPTGYYLARITRLLRSPVPRTDNSLHISNVDAGIALAQLERLPTILSRRRKVAEHYHRMLTTKLPQLSFPQYAPGRFLARVMLMLPLGIDARIFQARLAKAGVEARLGYEVIDSTDQESRIVKSMARRLIGPPCGAGMSELEVHQVGAAFSKVLDSFPIRDVRHETHKILN